MLNRVALLAAGALLSLGVASGAQSQTAPDHRSRTGQTAPAPAAARPATPVAAATPAVPGHVRANEAAPRLASPANRTAPDVARGPVGPAGAASDMRMEERRMEDRRGREWSRDEGRHHGRFGREAQRGREHGSYGGGEREYAPRR